MSNTKTPRWVNGDGAIDMQAWIWDTARYNHDCPLSVKDILDPKKVAEHNNHFYDQAYGR